MCLVPGNHGHGLRPPWMTPAVTAGNQASRRHHSPTGTLPPPSGLPKSNHTPMRSAPLVCLIFYLLPLHLTQEKSKTLRYDSPPGRNTNLAVAAPSKTSRGKGTGSPRPTFPPPLSSDERAWSPGPWLPPLKDLGDRCALLTIQWRTCEPENHPQPDAGAQLQAVPPADSTAPARGTRPAAAMTSGACHVLSQRFQVPSHPSCVWLLLLLVTPFWTQFLISCKTICLE